MRRRLFPLAAAPATLVVAAWVFGQTTIDPRVIGKPVDLPQEIVS